MKLDLRLIIPGVATGTVLQTAEGSLPGASVDGDEDEAAVVAVTEWLRDVVGFRAPILETHPRWADVPEGAPVPTLVLTEPAPARWQPPEGLAFAPIPDVAAGLPPAIAPSAAALLEELRIGVDPPPLRPRWARRGWQARTIDAWAGPADSVAVRDAIDDILVVGAAYQVVSYEGIIRALEPATRYTMGGGASHFLGRLEAILDRDSTAGAQASR